MTRLRSRRRPFPMAIPCIALAALALAACSGPRMLRLDEKKYPRRPSVYPIDLYTGGVVLQPHREIAVIETTAYADDAADVRRKQLEELKAKARRLGADAVQDVRILVKKVSGVTIDERVPFPAWKQGEYPLYFMRGTAIIYESSLPGAVALDKGFDVEVEEVIEQ